MNIYLCIKGGKDLFSYIRRLSYNVTISNKNQSNKKNTRKAKSQPAKINISKTNGHGEALAYGS